MVDQQTWDRVTGSLLDHLFPDVETREAASRAIEYDLDSRSISPGAAILAESNDQWIDRLAPFDPDGDKPAFGERVESTIAELIRTNVCALDGADELLGHLASTDVLIALATNDSEASARNQVALLGWQQHFDAIVGYDSGHGAKPAPGMLLALLEHFHVRPADALMVGDTWADQHAAEAAGIPFALVQHGNLSEIQEDVVG